MRPLVMPSGYRGLRGLHQENHPQIPERSVRHHADHGMEMLITIHIFKSRPMCSADTIPLPSEQGDDEKLLHRVSFRFSEVPLLTGQMLDQYLSCSGSSLVVVHASRQWMPSAIACPRCPMRCPGAREFLPE